MKKVRSTAFGAFGQFVIVLAGVVGALWAQEWAEERSRLSREAVHLTALRDGIAKTQEAANLVDSIVRGRTVLLTEFLVSPEAVIDNPLHTVDSLVYEGLFRLGAASLAIPAFEDLKSSGELSLIGSRELRLQLQTMDAARNNVRTNTEGLARFQETRLDPVLISRTNFVQLMTAFGIDTIPTPREVQDHSSLLMDPEVRGLVGFKIGLSRIVVRDGEVLRIAFDSTLVLIDQRLDELGATRVRPAG